MNINYCIGVTRNRFPGFVGAIALSLSSALLSAPNVLAGEDGRYQAIVLHQGGASGQPSTLSPKVFILDTRDGHMWTWEQNAWIKDPRGDLQFGTTTTYQGRLKTGSRMGEIIEQSR